MPTAVWFVLAAVAVGLGVWAMGNDEFSEIVSDSRTTHSLASSFGMGYLFMLVTQAIHPGKYGYAYVTLAKKGMTFSAFDPGTWHFTFIVFLILLLISTLAALILSGGRQEVVIKCSEYDDEPEHIPLPNKVYVRHKPKK